MLIALALSMSFVTSPIAAYAAGPYQWGDNPGRTHVSNLNDQGGYWNTSALISGISGIGTPEGDPSTGMLFVPNSAPNPNSDGTLYGYDTNATWVKNANGSMQPQQSWSQAIYGIQNSSPVAWQGNVYVAGSQTLYGFNGANGSKISTFKSSTDNIAIPGANNVVMSHPLADPGQNAIWVSSHNGYLFAISPTTLGQLGKVKLGGGTDSSPSIVQDSGGYNRVAVGISNYGGQAGEVEIISDSASNPKVMATYVDPNHQSIVGAVVDTGQGNLMWSDISGTVYHANLVYNSNTNGVSITNVTSVPAPSGTFTNEEAGFVHNYFILPDTNSPGIELVNGSTMAMTVVKSSSGSNNSGTPEISSTTVYIPAADGTLTEIPIGVLGGSATYIQSQESSITVGGSAGNLASTNMTELGNPFGGRSVTMTFVTSRGLSLFQNLPYPTLGMTVQDNATGQQMSAISYTNGQFPTFPTLFLPAGTAVNVNVTVLDAPAGQKMELSSPSVPLIYNGGLRETGGSLPPGSPFALQGVAVNEGANAASFSPSSFMKTFDLSAINGGTAPIALNSQNAQTDVLNASLSMAGLGTLNAGIKIDWTPVTPPTLSLSATPITPQVTGQTFHLTAGTTNAKGDRVRFTQSGTLTNNGGTGTLSGNFESNRPRITYSAQQSASYAYHPTATSSQAGSEGVTAELFDAQGNPVVVNGQPVKKSVSVTWRTPVAPPSVSLAPATQTVANGATGILTVTAKNLTATERVVVTDASGHFTLVDPNTGGMASSYTGSAGQSPFSLSVKDPVATQTTDTYKAVIENANGSPLSGVTSATATVTFDPPGEAITLTATTQTGTAGTAVTTTAGEPVTLTATGSDIQANDAIVIVELSGGNPNDGSLSASPITETTVQMQGSAQTNTWYSSIFHTSYAVKAYADSTSRSPQAITYEATLFNANGQMETATATVAWDAPKITISASPSLPPINTATTVTGTVAPAAALPSDGMVSIHNASGANVGFSPANATSSTVQTIRYYAAAQIEGYVYVSGKTPVTWTDQASITLTPAPDIQTSGQPITMQTAAGNLTTGQRYLIQVADGGGNAVFSGASFAQQTFTATTSAYTGFAPQAVSNSALANEPFVATLTDYATGQQESTQATATWQSATTSPSPSAASLTLDASIQAPSTTQQVTLTATGNGLSAGDTIEIVQESPPTPNTFVSGGTSVGGYEQVSGTADPLATSVQNTSGQGGFSAQYDAVAVNASGQTEATSSPVVVTWGTAAVATANLSANPSTLGVSSMSTLTATVSGGNPGDVLEVYLVADPSGPVNVNPLNPTSNPPVIVQGIDASGNAVGTAEITQSAMGQYTYQIVLWNGSEEDSIGAGTTKATITFTQAKTLLSASALQVEVGQSVTLTATQPGGDNTNTANQSYTVGFAANGTAYYSGNTSFVNSLVNIQQTAQTGKIAGDLLPAYPIGDADYPFGTPPPVAPVFMSISGGGAEWEGLVTDAAPSASTTAVSDIPGAATFQAHYAQVLSDFSYFTPAGETLGEQNPYVPPQNQFTNTNSTPVTITWVNPSVTLSASPTSLLAGQTSLLTATPNVTLPSGQSMVITDQCNEKTLGGHNQAASTADPFQTNATDPSAGTDTYVATIVNKAGQTLATSNVVTVTWHAPPSISLQASANRVLIQTPVTLTASATGVSGGFLIKIADLSYDLTLQNQGASIATGNTNPFLTQAVSDSSRTETYQAFLENASGKVVASSKAISVTWYSTATIQLKASASMAPAGTPVTLTASGAGYPSSSFVKIVDESGASTLGGANSATGVTDPFFAQAVSSQVQTVLYRAFLLDLRGNVVARSNTVQVTWRHSYLSDGIISGLYLDPGYPGSGKAPPNLWLSADMNTPSIVDAPSDFYLPWLEAHGWDGSEADLHESLGQALGGSVNYQPDKNSAPQSSQATGTFTTASGKTYYLYGLGEKGGAPWGNTPWVWVRPESGFGFRFLWQGTAANPPVGGTVTWTLVNPDGASRTWSTHFQNTATGPAQWTSIDKWMGSNASPIEESRTMVAELNHSTWRVSGNTASEYISAYSSIPHYVFVGGGRTSNGSNIQTAAWSLSSSAATVQANSAKVNVQIQLQLKDGTVLTMNQPDMVTLFNLPVRDIVTIGNDTFLYKAQKELKNNGGIVGMFPGTMNGVTPPSTSSTGTISTTP